MRFDTKAKMILYILDYREEILTIVTRLLFVWHCIAGGTIYIYNTGNWIMNDEDLSSGIQMPLGRGQRAKQHCEHRHWKPFVCSFNNFFILLTGQRENSIRNSFLKRFIRSSTSLFSASYIHFFHLLFFFHYY